MDSTARKNIVGYKVVLGVIIIRIVNRSVPNVFGLLFERFFKKLKSSPLEISFVSNLTLIIFNFTGIIAGWMLKAIPIKLVTISGTLLVSCGIILTSFVHSFDSFVFTFSVIVGLGLGLLSISSLLAVLKCFDGAGRNQAVGISLTGSKIGDVILPQIVGYLLKFYGARATVFVIGVQALLGTLSTFVLFPSKLSMSAKPLANEEEHHLLEKPDQSGKEIIDIENQTVLKKISSFMDLSMVKDKEFMVLVIGIAIAYSVNADFVLILPLFLKVTI
jgi:MFS family permease